MVNNSNEDLIINPRKINKIIVNVKDICSKGSCIMVNADEEKLRQLSSDIELTHNENEKKELKSERNLLLRKLKLIK